MFENKNFTHSLKRVVAKIFPNLARWYLSWLSAFKDFKRLYNTHDPIVVYRQTIHTVEKIESLKDHTSEPQSLLNSILIVGNLYTFSGEVYDCRFPGLYRFIDPQHMQEQRVVLSYKKPVDDALFLSLIAMRGNSDDHFTVQKLEQLSQNRFLRLTCGPLSSFIVYLLKQAGVNCRLVHSYTAETWDSYNSSHTLVEVWEPSLHKYVLVDVDKKAVFLHEGRLLSLLELSEAFYYHHTVVVESASPLGLVDWSGFSEKYTNFSYGFLEYLMYANTQGGILQTLSRICQIPVIEKNGKFFACCWNIIHRDFCQQQLPGYTVCNPHEFAEIFYTEE